MMKIIDTNETWLYTTHPGSRRGNREEVLETFHPEGMFFSSMIDVHSAHKWEMQFNISSVLKPWIHKCFQAQKIKSKQGFCVNTQMHHLITQQEVTCFLGEHSYHTAMENKKHF